MEQLCAPWRMEYILAPKTEGCIFCDKPLQNCDEDNYILYRGERNFVIMNSWPYNPGHVMVAPYKHAAGLEDLSDEELKEHWELVRSCVARIKNGFHPDGFNIGINIGKVAGAGVLGHVHTHIVPRWVGDVNFMPVISNTRVLPEALASTYRKLKEELKP